jgi:hypothetical protein
MTTSITAKIIKTSGLILTPSVSSSKNLNSPALAAGIGLEPSFFFLLISASQLWLENKLPLLLLINVASTRGVSIVSKAPSVRLLKP